MGSEEECRGFAVRATIGGGGRWERSVRWMQILKNNWKLFYHAGIGRDIILIIMFSFTGGVVSTEVEKRRWDEDGFLVSLKSIRYICLSWQCTFLYLLPWLK